MCNVAGIECFHGSMRKSKVKTKKKKKSEKNEEKFNTET